MRFGTGRLAYSPIPAMRGIVSLRAKRGSAGFIRAGIDRLFYMSVHQIKKTVDSCLRSSSTGFMRFNSNRLFPMPFYRIGRLLQKQFYAASFGTITFGLSRMALYADGFSPGLVRSKTDLFREWINGVMRRNVVATKSDAMMVDAIIGISMFRSRFDISLVEELIKKCNEAPNSTTVHQLAGLIGSLPQAHKIIQRDAQGRAKVAAPAASDDIARLREIIDSAKRITHSGFGLYQEGRDLMAVLGVFTVPDAMAALRERCNGVGTPDFSGLQIGDYLDGIDLSAIPSENGGTAGQPWNGTYKNNRLALSAFNPYKGVGDTEVTKNHVRFDFANVPLRKRMNSAYFWTGPTGTEPGQGRG
jgi:hypothetical protein